MPNHVTNFWNISLGGDAAAARTQDLLGVLASYGSVIDFARIKPPPNVPAYRDEPSQSEARSSPDWWYTWNTKHWGTKWNAYRGVVVSSEPEYGLHQIAFLTAWSMPKPVIEEVARKYVRREDDIFEGLATCEGYCFATAFLARLTEDGDASVVYHDIPKSCVPIICESNSHLTDQWQRPT